MDAFEPLKVTAVVPFIVALCVVTAEPDVPAFVKPPPTKLYKPALTFDAPPTVALHVLDAVLREPPPT